MTDDTLYNTLLIAVFIFIPMALIGTYFINGDYGRFSTGKSRLPINVRLGWVLMESPACLIFLYCFIIGDNRSWTAFILLFMWQLHYFHRSFIYPFQIKVRPGASMSLQIFGTGGVYCAINGYLNGSLVGDLGEHLTNEWLTDPRFILGILIFAFGFWLNKYSDQQLLALRKNNIEGYQIPYGGGFKWVTMPNYLGEIFTWTGFAMASWSLAGLSFVLFTAANLIPRALANHRWYKEEFPKYPTDRKAIFPKIL